MGKVSVNSEVAGTVWQMSVEPGQRVAHNEVLAVLESMKMELPVLSPSVAVVSEVHVAESDFVREGQLILTLELPST